MTAQNLQPGKLYKIISFSVPPEALGEKLVDGLIVYKVPVDLDGSLSRSWVTIHTGAVVMWLGEEGCGPEFAKVLHGDTVWHVFLGHKHNLKRLQRVL